MYPYPKQPKRQEVVCGSFVLFAEQQQAEEKRYDDSDNVKHPVQGKIGRKSKYFPWRYHARHFFTGSPYCGISFFKRNKQLCPHHGITDVLYVRNRDEWRTWLETNHCSAREIWL